jgi:ribonuclease R
MPFDRKSVLSALGESYDSGLKFSELARQLGVRKGEQHRLRKMLNSMMNQGEVSRIGRGTYAVANGDDNDSHAAERGPTAVGRISIHPAGYGFVAVDDGSDDIFVPAKYRGAALDGDRVVVYTWDGYKGTEGRVEEIVSRGRAKLTGVLRKGRRALFLEPDDPRIASDYGTVELVDGAGAGKVGQAAVVEITEYPTEERPYIAGKLTRVLGDPDDPRTEIEKIITCADIPDEMPADALAQAKQTPQNVLPEDLADRIDLRDRPFVTIDPETARDFDDALCIESSPHGGVRVWVAVADVSHYVRPGDALDREAVMRGVSVYLPDRVVPMLPFELSAGICSLNPEVDRCAMVVRLDFDERARLVETGFAAAVIHSQARLDYPGVAAALKGDFRGRRERYRQWAPALTELDRLAQRLRKRRLVRGALNLELPEPKVVLDEDDPRRVRDVVRAKGLGDVKRAYQLVEEMMIAANEAVGSFFREREAETMWRVHAPPKPERLEELAMVLASYGIKLDVEDAATPVGMRDVVEQVSELPAAQSLMFLVLRSLKQAVYQTDNVGHFGLASEEYLHFTSPIRRYPDLIVHRLLKHHLHREGQASGGAAALGLPSKSELQEMAAASSGHERRALEAEREAVAMYRAYFMREQVGEEFTGRVSAITNFGIFVEIDEPYVEGLIRLQSLDDDFYQYDRMRMELAGRATGKIISLGDSVLVEVVEVSVQRRRIELRLLSVSGQTKRRPAAANSGGKGGARKGRGRASNKGRGRAKTSSTKRRGAKVNKQGKGKGKGKGKKRRRR